MLGPRRALLLLALLVPCLSPAAAAAAAAAAAGNGTAAESGRPPPPPAAAAAGTPLPRMNQEDLLKWGLAHSDPDALRAAAEEARRLADAGAPEFLERQARVQQLLDAMKGEPTEAELMKEAVAVLANASSTHQQLGAALDALRYLVEPIDAANNLQGMGGLAPLVALLGRHQPARLQARAAYALGTAASNNREFQLQLLGDHPEALPLLLSLLDAGAAAEQQQQGSGGAAVAAAAAAEGEEGGEAQQRVEAGIKALYCLSAILRLTPAARAAFYRSGGMPALQALLRQEAGGSGGARLQRKALGLLADLVQADAGAHQGAGLGLDYPAAVAAALQLLEAQGRAPQEARDQDLQEKALLVLLQLLESGGPAAGGEAAALIAGAGGLPTLQALEDGWRSEAAAAQEQDEFLGDLVALCQRVRRAAAAASAKAGGGGGGGGAAVTGSLGGGSSAHDASEL